MQEPMKKGAQEGLVRVDAPDVEILVSNDRNTSMLIKQKAALARYSRQRLITPAGTEKLISGLQYLYNASIKSRLKDVQMIACRTGTRSSMEKPIVSRSMRAEQRQNNERTHVRIRRWPDAYRNLPQQGRA
ncbi:unnamed protein product [Gongylonema pulchrum]|uniref:Reverse transcriptase n=1 Tax=Gongylonema pulchrum TaxID=637853 RepID=A0A183ESE3_9BILA|nr:unnamed protein product [Gongylonema pulchrum]